jgi:hypothetical protein
MGSAGAMVAATARAAEPLTLEEIRSQLAKERSQLQNLYIEVTTDYKLAVDPKVYLTLPGHNKNVILVKETSQYAFKGEKHYKRTLCPAVVKSPWPLEPLKGDNKPRDEYHLAPDETVVCTGKLEWERRIMEKGKPSNLFIMGADSSGHWGQPPGYLISIGWAIPDPTEHNAEMVRAQHMNCLPDLFTAEPYTVAKDVAVVDGARCAVLHNHREVKVYVAGGGRKPQPLDDTIWLDLDHGLAMKQRDNVIGTDHVTRTLCGDFVEILPGLWFPKHVLVQCLVPLSGPAEYRGKPMLVGDTRLTKWVVNQVPDDLFDIVPRPAKDEQVYDMRMPQGVR